MTLAFAAGTPGGAVEIVADIMRFALMAPAGITTPSPVVSGCCSGCRLSGFLGLGVGVQGLGLMV